MSSASRRPAIAGAGQITQRLDDPREAASPLDLMEQALRRAAQDAGAPKLLESLDAIYVPHGLWRYGDPGALLAERVGASGARTALGAISGHIVQILVNRACSAIAEGRADVIAIVGGESEHSRRRLKRQDLDLPWSDDQPGEPDLRYGKWERGLFPHELTAGISDAVSCFSLCETALRAFLGETPSAHRRRISELQARMSEIAAVHPQAWIREPVSAAKIREPGPTNRMVGYPYTKLMTSNIAVDQAAALILCSEEAGERFGVAPDRRVYLRASTEMGHSTSLSERDVLHRHPGQEIAAARVLELADADASDLEAVDLYSCFPFAVQAGARALGLGLDPPPSLTGGMTFGGGPFGNYVLQAKATLVERLRATPGSLGLIGSVGGYFAHFGYGLYSSDPGDRSEPAIEDVGAEFSRLPRRPYLAEFDGSARVEAYTVAVDARNDARACLTALTEGGERVWGRSADPDLTTALLADEEACGREARIRDGLLELV